MRKNDFDHPGQGPPERSLGWVNRVSRWILMGAVDSGEPHDTASGIVVPDDDRMKFGDVFDADAIEWSVPPGTSAMARAGNYEAISIVVAEIEDEKRNNTNRFESVGSTMGLDQDERIRRRAKTVEAARRVVLADLALQFSHVEPARFSIRAKLRGRVSSAGQQRADDSGKLLDT